MLWASAAVGALSLTQGRHNRAILFSFLSPVYVQSGLIGSSPFVSRCKISPSPWWVSPAHRRDPTTVGIPNFSLPPDSGSDAEFSEEIRSLDSELAREIEEALNLANDALAVEGQPIGAIGNETSLPEPAPPNSVAPPSVFDKIPFLIEKKGDNGLRQPSPPESPPSISAVSFGENLRKAVAIETNRLRKSLFDLKEDLKQTELLTKSAEESAASLREEIETNKRERETMVKEIEEQYLTEKNLLTEQLGNASVQLQFVRAQSAENITQARSDVTRSENELLSRIDALTASIEQAAGEAKLANLEKERLQTSMQQKYEELTKEMEDKVARYRSTLDAEGENTKIQNIEMQRKAEEVERRVFQTYKDVNQTRFDRLSVQQQIEKVQKDGLEEILTLERQMVDDSKKYDQLLGDERSKIDKIFTETQKNYSAILDKERKKRQSLMESFSLESKQKDKEREYVVDRIMSLATVRLEELKAKFVKERINLYQQKFEAVDAVKKDMLSDLAIEEKKLKAISDEMEGKLESIRKEVAQAQAEIESEITQRRSIVESERLSLLSRIEEIQSNMTSKIDLQRNAFENETSNFINEQNIIISKSDEKCRVAWMELAKVKKQLETVRSQKAGLVNAVSKKNDVIQSHERDKVSLRKSLSLSWKIARDKVGSKTKRLLRRKKNDS